MSCPAYISVHIAQHQRCDRSQNDRGYREKFVLGCGDAHISLYYTLRLYRKTRLKRYALSRVPET